MNEFASSTYCLVLLQDGLANPKSKESISKEGKVTERIIERIIICPGGQPYISPPPQPPLQPCLCPSQQGGEKKKKGKKKRIDEDDGLCNHPYCIVQRSKIRPQGWVLSKVNFIIIVCRLTCIYVCTYIMYIVSKSWLVVWRVSRRFYFGKYLAYKFCNTNSFMFVTWFILRV